MASVTPQGDTETRSSPAELRLPVVDGDVIPLAAQAGRFIKLAIAATLIVLAVIAVGAVTIPVQITVRASGTLEPQQVWPVRSTVDGVIARLCVSSGDTVRAQQVLVVLDTLESAAAVRRLRRELSQAHGDKRRETSLTTVERVEAETNLARAEALLVKAQANLRAELADARLPVDLDALRSSHKTGSHVSVDRALADLLAAEADLRASRARVTELEQERPERPAADYRLAILEEQLRTELERQGRSRVTSPAAGIVITDTIERLSGAAIQRGEVVFEVASLDGWNAELIVSEADAPRVAPRSRVTLEIPALSSLRPRYVLGTVEHVAREPARSADAQGGYEVLVIVNDRDMPSEWRRAIRRGYSVHGRIVVKQGTLAQMGIQRLRARS
jgi:macrolide-specific efflux system membrane fusion protein